jgi:phenylacetate-coenzyme A ligase PaaK-like adenylate-forming protein
MPRIGRRPHLRMFLAGRPYLADRLFQVLGAGRVEKIARRSAMRAALRAYRSVPFYRDLYQRAGFDERRMRSLTWEDFGHLPTVGKSDMAAVSDQDLLDSTVPFPAGDAIIYRSSGTTGKPTIIPTGWDDFYVNYAIFKRLAQSLGVDRTRSIILQAYGVDGSPGAGSVTLRCYFTLKQETHWPFEICAAGETPDTIISFLRYYTENRFETLYLLAFPGTMERVLDRLQDLTAQDRNAGVDWQQFRRKRIQLSGQVVSRDLRARIRSELAIAEDDLNAIEILMASTDSGLIFASSTPFTLWLERYMEQRPEIAELLGIPAAHWTKPLMEFVPSLSILLENDPDAGLLLTTWKHRPIIRFRSNDLAWLQSSRAVVKILNRNAKGWRKDFARYGYKRADIPQAATLGMILGRADDVCIVNGANITPDVLRNALQAAGILPHIHHFKHGIGAGSNEYDVYLELPDQSDAQSRDRLATEWTPGLLEALVTHPAAIELQAAHRGTPIDLQVFVRSRGEGEFAGDDQAAKKRFTVEARPIIPAVLPG